jgi:hypothetical protein
VRAEQHWNYRLMWMRLKAPPRRSARASVYRELAYLRHSFRLMLKAGDISAFPVIELLRGENVRKGFIAPAEFKSSG